MRGLILLFLSTSAFAGDVRFNVNIGVGLGRYHQPRRHFVPHVQQPYYWYWIPYTPPAPPPPQIIYIEREPAEREVVIVQLPPVEAPAPVAAAVPAPVAPVPAPVPAPVAAQPAMPIGPRVPGPDVFHWTDEDGVVHYSTRVPADARKRAKKLAMPAK